MCSLRLAEVATIRIQDRTIYDGNRGEAPTLRKSAKLGGRVPRSSLGEINRSGCREIFVFLTSSLPRPCVSVRNFVRFFVEKGLNWEGIYMS